MRTPRAMIINLNLLQLLQHSLSDSDAAQKRDIVPKYHQDIIPMMRRTVIAMEKKKELLWCLLGQGRRGQVREMGEEKRGKQTKTNPRVSFCRMPSGLFGGLPIGLSRTMCRISYVSIHHI
ncbi:hypothetical protein M9H77_02855 [Catharanthus roseus]|uniref:Uncharacterized protein n=1 Tax=Catharanthus roseus TaxID=4058 RepID=A0ACC0C9V1_CATRO|nr:hypothetical protein M9H77_02855 [Catharanthus roseus]